MKDFTPSSPTLLFAEAKERKARHAEEEKKSDDDDEDPLP